MDSRWRHDWQSSVSSKMFGHVAALLPRKNTKCSQKCAMLARFYKDVALLGSKNCRMAALACILLLVSAMSYQTLLVPVDFSDCSHEVVKHAVSLARDTGATLRLLHVVNLPAGVSRDTRMGKDGAETAFEHLEADAKRHFKAYQGTSEVKLVEEIREGKVLDEILGAAKEHKADVIVMGTHGRTGLARSLFGSVAEGVLRQAECPVLTLRSVHKPTCDARSCSWCDSGVTSAQRDVEVELTG